MATPLRHHIVRSRPAMWRLHGTGGAHGYNRSLMQVVALAHALIVAMLAAVALQTLLNHRTLRRLARRRAPAPAPRVAVLIPARDEARRIGAAVRGWAAQDYPD